MVANPDKAKIAKHHARLSKQYLRAYREKIENQQKDLEQIADETKEIKDAENFFWLKQSPIKPKGKQLSILDLIEVQNSAHLENE